MLASQAPSVSISSLKIPADIDDTVNEIGTNRTSLKVKPSKASKDIRKWDCCIIRAITIVAGNN